MSTARTFGAIGDILKGSAAKYVGVFQQVNASLEYRNSLIRLGARYLEQTTEEITAAMSATADYGMDVRMTQQAWGDVSRDISMVNYLTGASVVTLSKLANFTQLLRGNFEEISTTMLGIVSASSLTGDEVADIATTLSDINLIYGRGTALSKEQLTITTGIADRIKQAGGNAKSFVAAVREANTKFTGAAAMGFLPGFADSARGMAAYSQKFNQFGEMVMRMSPVIRGVMADAFGQMFNQSGDELLRNAKALREGVTQELSPQQSLKKQWMEAVGSLGGGINRLATIGKNLIRTFIQPAINRLNAWSMALADDKGNLMGWAKDFQDWIANTWGRLSTWWRTDGQDVKKSVKEFWDDIDGGAVLASVASGIGTVAKAFKAAGDWIGETAAKVAEWNAASPNLVKGIALVGGAVALFAWKFRAASAAVASSGGGFAAGIVAIASALATATPLLITAVPGIAIITAAVLGMAVAFRIAGPSIAQVVRALGEALSRVFDSVLKNAGEMGKLIKSSLEGVATVVTAVGAVVSGFVHELAGGTVSMIHALTDSVERMAGVGGGNLASTAGGLTALSVSLGLFAAAEVVSGVTHMVSWFTGGESLYKRLLDMAKIGPGLQMAGDGLRVLSKAIKSMPAKMGFAFNQESYAAVQRLRDATIILDGGRPELERIVGLFERLQRAVSSMTDVRIGMRVESSAQPVRGTPTAGVISAPSDAIANALEKLAGRAPSNGGSESLAATAAKALALDKERFTSEEARALQAEQASSRRTPFENAIPAFR